MMLAENRDLQNKMKDGLMAYIQHQNLVQGNEEIIQLMKLLSSKFDLESQSFKETKGKMDSSIFNIIMTNMYFQFEAV